jgi:hypothetical protein
MDLQPFLVPLLSAVASFIGAWLAAHFALRRFYKERIWERKVAAYSAIFAALHDIETWYSKHLGAHIKDRPIPDTVQEKLRLAANTAEDELERKLATETWLIPDHCRKRIAQLTADLSKQPTSGDWVDYLTKGGWTIGTAINELRDMVRADLGIKSKN